MKLRLAELCGYRVKCVSDRGAWRPCRRDKVGVGSHCNLLPTSLTHNAPDWLIDKARAISSIQRVSLLQNQTQTSVFQHRPVIRAQCISPHPGAKAPYLSHVQVDGGMKILYSVVPGSLSRYPIRSMDQLRFNWGWVSLTYPLISKYHCQTFFRSLG